MAVVFKNDKLVLTDDGDVENFNPVEIQAAIDNIPKESFWEKHCLALYQGDCDKCTMAACPVTN